VTYGFIQSFVRQIIEQVNIKMITTKIQ